MGRRPLWGHCPSHIHTSTYTQMGATGTADHLTLLRLLSILLPSCPPSFSLSFFLVFPPPFLFLISLTLFCLFSNPSRENQTMSLPTIVPLILSLLPAPFLSSFFSLFSPFIHLSHFSPFFISCFLFPLCF